MKIDINDIRKVLKYPNLLQKDALDLIVEKLEEIDERLNKIQFRCPYDGVAYSKVPGYVKGYGCPVCKGIGPSHILVKA